MEFQTLDVNRRAGTGKGRARKLRATGRVPGVVYGPGMDTLSIDLVPKDLRKALDGPFKRNTVLKIVVHEQQAASEYTAMLLEAQIHPTSRAILHADFLKVDVEKEVDVSVPLVTTGKCKGVLIGGILIQIYHQLPLRCKPADIPVTVETDVTELMIGQGIKVAALTLPPGVSVRLEPDQTVVSVTAPVAEEKPKAEAELAEGEVAEGEAAAAEGGAKTADGKPAAGKPADGKAADGKAAKPAKEDKPAKGKKE